MKILLLVFSFFTMVSSCEKVVEEQEITAEGLELQLSKIHAYINSFECSNNGCSYMAYGSKACGGPQGYLIFPNNIDREILKSKVDKYSKDEDTFNKQHDIMSDCNIPSPPQNLKCENGKCIAVD